jgi:YVTN family beta-propeller protein
MATLELNGGTQGMSCAGPNSRFRVRCADARAPNDSFAPTPMRRPALQGFLLLFTASIAACRGTTGPRDVQTAHPGGTLAARASGLVGRPFGIRVSSGGVVFVTQQDANSVARFNVDDLAAGQSIAVGADPGDVIFSHDGTRAFVSNFNDGTVQVLDVATGARGRLLLVAPTNAYRLALAPDDSRLYVTSTNGRLYAVDPTGTAAASSVLLGGSLQGIAISRDGATLTASSTDGRVWRVNAATLAVLTSQNLGSPSVQDVALSPDETELYVANENGFVDVLDPTTLQPIRRLTVAPLLPFGLAVTSDGAQIYVTSPGTGTVGIVDRGTGAVLLRPVGGVPRRIAFDASGSTALISNENNWVDVIR